MKALKSLIYVVLIGSLILNVVLYGKTRKRAVISVNTQGISQKDIDNYLERQAGQQVKATMVQKALIEQAAKKNGVEPTKEEVDAAYNEQKELNWQVAREVMIYPFAADKRKDDLRLALMQQELLYKDVQVTDEEIKEEYNRRPSYYDAPDKAKTSFCVVLKDGDVAEIKSMMEKNTQPSVLTAQKRNQVAFLGDNYVYTFAKPFAEKSKNVAIEQVFGLKPGAVLQLPPSEFQKEGAKAVLVRLDHLELGKKADLNDPKTKKRVRNVLASQRAVPWKEYLNKLWADMKFESEEPNDKKYIESILFPEKAAAEANK